MNLLEINLLGKTELRIDQVELKNVNLTELATLVANTLKLNPAEVLVVDVREDHITLDILKKTVYAEDIYGKEKVLLKRLSQLPGVGMTDKSSIHSQGILGLIALDEKEAKEVIERTKIIEQDMKQKILKRAIVFPTGFEVKKGMIKDTNTPMITERLLEEGYKVTKGPILEDDESQIVEYMTRAIGNGYGLIITTGGVGAEDKDKTVESILKVDQEAATSYIAKFEKGTGRHMKDGVKIAVGKVGNTTIVALPGPNDEAKIGLDVVIAALKSDLDKKEFANRLAEALRERLRVRMKHSE